MEVQYRRKPDQTCLVFGKEGSPDSYAVRVLEENRIPGILEMKIITVDQKDEFHFDVTGYQPLTRLWEKQQISISDIYLVLSGIYRIAKTLEDYLIDAGHIVLKPEYIFVKKTVSDIHVCCHPGYNGDFYAQIRELAQYFINKIDHGDREGTRRAYEIYRITGEDFFSFEELLDISRPDVADIGQKGDAITDEAKAGEAVQVNHDDGWDDVPPYKSASPETAGMASHVEEDIEDVDGRYAILGLRRPEMAATLIACACIGFGVYFFVRKGSLQKGCMMLAASAAIFIMITIERIITKKEKPGEKDHEYSAGNGQDEEPICWSGQVGGDRFSNNVFEEGGSQGVEMADRISQTIVSPMASLAEPSNVDVCAHGMPADGDMDAEEHDGGRNNHFLLRKDSELRDGIRLLRMPFVIGSLKENCDWLIWDRDEGTVQVRLDEISGEYYLADVGSAKGIRINGMPLQSHRRCQIKEGDEILIAGQKFVFQ